MQRLSFYLKGGGGGGGEEKKNFCIIMLQNACAQMQSVSNLTAQQVWNSEELALSLRKLIMRAARLKFTEQYA